MLMTFNWVLIGRHNLTIILKYLTTSILDVRVSTKSLWMSLELHIPYSQKCLINTLEVHIPQILNHYNEITCTYHLGVIQHHFQNMKH
jgi:hypothetical protein